jgi:hypothetical protein
MRQWFGPDAGKPGTHYQVNFVREREGWTVKPMGGELVQPGDPRAVVPA